VNTFRNPDGKSPKTLDSNFLLFPLVALAFSQLLGFFLSSYFQIKLTETLIFKVEDGWCDLETQGIGSHCFGDFSSFMSSQFNAPWTNSNTAYPPFSIIFFLFFKFVYMLSNESNLALFGYLLLLLASLLLPVFYFVRSGMPKLHVTVLSVFFLLLAPALMVIDRGNNIGFSVPLIFFAYIFAIQKKYSHFQFAILFLTLLKPQFALMGVFLLIMNQKRTFLIYLLNTTLGYSISFLLFGPQDFVKNIASWLLNLFDYQSYVDMPTVFPTNLSFSNLFSLFLFVIGKGSDAFGEFSSRAIADSRVFSVTSLAFLVIILCLIYRKRHSMNEIQILTSILIVIIMTPTVSFSYYLALLLPFIYLLFFCLLREDPATPARKDLVIEVLLPQFEGLLNSRFKRTIFYGFFVTSFVNWPIPWRFLGVPESSLTSILSVVWIFSSAFLLLFLGSLIFSKGIKQEGERGRNFHPKKLDTR
jgi:hypothetical protein